MGGSTYSLSSLPSTVKALPGKAQELWRETYNTAIKRYTEEQASEMAWAAVRSRYVERSGTWSSKDETMIRDVLYEELIDIQDSNVSGLRMTKDGFLIATPRVARTGVQQYLGTEFGLSKDVLNVFRPEAEVFHKDSTGTFAHRPITLDHPPVFVDASNWRDYAVGSAGDEILRDGEFIRVPMMIMDQKAIDAIKKGKAQLSVGYSSQLEFTTGVTDSGEAFDAIQRNIRVNHIAVVTTARGGPNLNLKDRAVSMVPVRDKGRSGEVMPNVKIIDIDGVKIELPETEGTVLCNYLTRIQKDAETRHQEATTGFNKAIETKDAEIAALKAAIAAKDTEIAALQKKFDEKTVTPKELDQMVADRALVVSQCKALVDGIQTDNADATDLKRQVVLKYLGDSAKDYSNESVAVAFSTLVASSIAKGADAGTAGTAGTTLRDVANSFARPIQNTGDAATLEAEHTKYNKRISDAWKNPN